MKSFKIYFILFYENTLGITNPYVLSEMPKTQEFEIIEAEDDVKAINKLAEKYGVGRIGSILSVESV